MASLNHDKHCCPHVEPYEQTVNVTDVCCELHLEVVQCALSIPLGG